jgi:hypothetical protein
VPDDVTPWADETTSDVSDAPRSRRGHWPRHIGVGILVSILVAAGVDLLGPRTGELTREGAGYTLAVQYPQIARAGEPAPLHVSVDSTDGFGDVVQLRFCDAYFDHLDFQSWYPNPSAETALPGSIIYEFDPPPSGTVLEISLDARVAPGQLGGRDSCEVSVLVEDEPVVTAAFTTWRVP